MICVKPVDCARSTSGLVERRDPARIVPEPEVQGETAGDAPLILRVAGEPPLVDIACRVGRIWQRAQEERWLILQKRSQARKRPRTVAEERQVHEGRLTLILDAEAQRMPAGGPDQVVAADDARLTLREGQHLVTADDRHP